MVAKTASKDTLSMGDKQRTQRRWLACLLAIATLILTLIPSPSLAQAPWRQSVDKAPVVIDGEVLFKVGGYSSLSAFERAELVNEDLEQLVNSSEKVDLEVNSEENGAIVIRRDGSNNHIITVTEGDVTTASSPRNQANIWEEKLEQAIRKARQERNWTYYRQGILDSLLILLGAVAIHFSFHFAGRRLVKTIEFFFTERNFSFPSWRKPIVNIVKLLLFFGQVALWIIAGYEVTEIFPQTRGWRYEIVNFLFYPLIQVGEKAYSILDVLLLLVFMVGLWFAVRTFTRIFKSQILSKIGADAGLQQVLSFISQYLLTFIGAILLLQIWGVNVSSLAIFASALGVGIGFGVQNIANNFISGVIITIEQPIQVGDFVELGGLEGTVRRIGARSTEILTLDQVAIIVPNSRFLENEVINRTHGNPITRMKIPVGVAYGSPIDEVRNALLEAATNHRDVLYRPKPEVWFDSFGDSSLNFELLVWTKEPQKQPRIRSDLNYSIAASLERHNLEVPFPQRDLHLRSPQLDKVLAAWLQQNDLALEGKGDLESEASLLEGKTYHNGREAKSEANPSPRPEQLISCPRVAEKLTVRQVEALVKAMRGQEGVEIGDRTYRFNRYQDCFIGSEAVDWLVEKEQYSREEAVKLGQILIERGIIHHITDEQSFKDGYFFYRFYADEQMRNFL